MTLFPFSLGPNFLFLQRFFPDSPFLPMEGLLHLLCYFVFHLSFLKDEATHYQKENNWQSCGEKGTLLHCRWEYKLVQLSWKTICKFLKKLNRATVSSSKYFYGYLYEENKNTNLDKRWFKKSKRNMHSYVHCSITHNSQDMETTNVFLGGWMDTEDVRYIYTHTHTRIERILNHKKNDILTFVTMQMNPESIMLSEISQIQTNTIWFHLICGI